MIRKNLLLLLLVILSFSCGTTNQEDVEDAIFHAKQLLTGGRCGEALEALAKVPYQNSNVDYLTTYASAHACNAGYSTVNFFLEDLDKLSTTQTGFLGSLATFSTSNMAQDNSSGYQSLWVAINSLITAGGITDVSYAGRTDAIGASQNSNLSVFALYLILAQLGNFTNYYGNSVDATGVKGGGGNPNECYLDYTDGTAQAGIGLQGGDSCDLFNEGSAELNGNRTRRCEGIVLFNNFLDIILNISFSGNNSGNLNDLKSIAGGCTAGATFNAETCEVKSVSECVSNTTDIDNVQIERYYGIIIENMHL